MDHHIDTPYRLGNGVYRTLCGALIVGAVVVVPPTATSEMYRALDQDGVISLTNVPADRRYQAIRFDASRLNTRVSKKELDQAIAWFSKQHRLPRALLRAVIKTESDFNPNAVSRTGAQGLMQLMPRTAVSLRVRNPFNPIENIRGGAKHLRHLIDRFDGNLPLALAAYNAGEYRVKRYQQIPPIEETRDYVEKVLRYYQVYRLGKIPTLSS